MSQKNAKRIRRLENRVDTMERSAASWDAAEAAVHNQAALDAAAERNAERRRARDAERAVIAWRRMTYAMNGPLWPSPPSGAQALPREWRMSPQLLSCFYPLISAAARS